MCLHLGCSFNITVNETTVVAAVCASLCLVINAITVPATSHVLTGFTGTQGPHWALPGSCLISWASSLSNQSLWGPAEPTRCSLLSLPDHSPCLSQLYLSGFIRVGVCLWAHSLTSKQRQGTFVQSEKDFRARSLFFKVGDNYYSELSFKSSFSSVELFGDHGISYVSTNVADQFSVVPKGS